MRWSYSITPDKVPDGTGRLRYRVAFGHSRVAFNLGLRIDLSKWNYEAQRSIPNVTHGRKKVPANYINRTIQKYIDATERIFMHYEEDDYIPTESVFRNDLNKALRRTPEASDNIIKVMEKFSESESSINQWGDGTIRHFEVLAKKIALYSPDALLSEMNAEWLEGFVRFLIYNVKLSNNTVKDYLKRIRWFMNWCVEHGERVPMDYKSFSPRLTTIKKPIIFLTWEELMTVYNTDMPTDYLTKSRDLFCFSCFTSLRFSDVQNLKPENVKDDYIEIVTQKTSDPLKIDLNDFSRAILEKYDKKLPKISNQKMNQYIKEVGMYCRIDTPITIVSIRQGKRQEVTQPKWRVLSTHAGRRTFISNALAMGIPADVVMKWTGHKDYDAMRPYIEIADDVKKASMNKFNVLNSSHMDGEH